MIFNDVFGFYTIKDICRILNIARATFYRILRNKGARFPPASTFTSDNGPPRWFIPEVHEWIRVQMKKPRDFVSPKKAPRKAPPRTGREPMGDDAR
jgi:predicted DNA-binding transcriptional regulator AlpA